MTIYLFTVSSNCEMRLITQSLHAQHISHQFWLHEEQSHKQKFALIYLGPKQNEFHAKFFNLLGGALWL